MNKQKEEFEKWAAWSGIHVYEYDYEITSDDLEAAAWLAWQARQTEIDELKSALEDMADGWDHALSAWRDQRRLLESIHKDLLLRADVDEDGTKVVNLSDSIWIELKEKVWEAEWIS